jgi:hypothetical protein
VDVATQSLITAATATSICQTVTAPLTAASVSRTNPVIVTFSALVTGTTTTWVNVPIPAAVVNVYDFRLYLADSTTRTFRARVDITRKDTMRCDNLQYFSTNLLFYSTTTTVAGAANDFTNVVTDASGILTGKDNMYTKPFLTPQTWQSATNASATVVAWACSNMVAGSIGDVISHVSRIPEQTYINKQGATNLILGITPWSNITNMIGGKLECLPL